MDVTENNSTPPPGHIENGCELSSANVGQSSQRLRPQVFFYCTHTSPPTSLRKSAVSISEFFKGSGLWFDGCLKHCLACGQKPTYCVVMRSALHDLNGPCGNGWSRTHNISESTATSPVHLWMRRRKPALPFELVLSSAMRIGAAM